MLRKAKKNERDGWDASSPDKKKQMDKEKQKKPNKPPEPPKRKEPRKARLISETKSQTPRPVVKYVPTPKKDRKESLDATETKGRKLSESGSRW
jgi:hypothetical protein